MSLFFWKLAGEASLAIWVYLVLGRGGFWRPPTIRLSRWSGESPIQGQAPQGAAGTFLAAIVPARDEAEVIARSITSLLEQSVPGGIQVFVVDDGSSDGTAGVALAAAEKAGKAQSLHVIPGQTLPPGWSGKLWAMQQGIACARAFAPRYLLLTDADIVHSPDELAGLIACMETGGFDLASLMVQPRCRSFAEKLLMPAFVFFFFQLYPPRWVADARRATAGAAGGCLLLRPEALERAGGLAAVRGEVIDDCALAGVVKRNGGKLWLGAARETASIRGEEGFTGIGRMIARTAFSQLRHSAVLLLLTMVAMTLMYLLPAVLAFSGRLVTALPGIAGWLLMTVAYRPTVRHCRLSLLWALTLPVAALFFTGATFCSALMYWCGQGGKWKGRVQDSRG
jgi:hopene-associated glycosyltransferase HpnB